MIIRVSIWVTLVALTSAVGSVAAAGDGLAEHVTIRRTAFGVPHVLADSEKAAAYGFAWAQCEDHFPLVYKAVVRGRHELSRWYGASDGNINDDFEVILFRARERAIETNHLLPKAYRDIQEGFAAGINAYMAHHPKEVEPWMTPVTPHDVGATRQVAVMRFTFNRGSIIRKFLQSKSKEARLLPDIPGEDMGSNTVALSPDRTTSGKAILLNNPHQPWSEEAHYYEAHITVPGVYNFYGSTFVGGPVLTTGFNRYLGWAHTVNYPDLEEIYEVALNPENPNEYEFDGGHVPLTHETVTILIDTDKPQSRDMWWSPLGPVILKTDTHAYVLRSVGYTQFLAGVQWYEMGKAKSIAEYRDALRMQAIAMFNIGYADRDGNIMYVWNGTVPEMPHQNRLADAVPAATADEIWRDIHPLDELMQLTNPKGGYIQNCNSPPYLTNLNEPMNRDDYPPYFPNNNLSLRTQHALELVHNDRIFSLEDVVHTKFSMKMLLAYRVKDDLIVAVRAASPTRDEERAVRMLERWNNSAAADSVGSVLFAEWWSAYAKGEPDYAVEWSEGDPVATPRGLSDSARAVEAFRAAMNACKARWGRWDVSWGHVHRLRKGNLDVPVGGGGGELGCFRVLKFKDAADGKRVVNSGDSFIFAVEFGDTPRAYSVLGYSESDRPDSKYFNDQSRLYAKNAMKQVAFTEEDIAAQLAEKPYRPGR